MRQVFGVVAIFASIIGLLGIFFTFTQVSQEDKRLTNDIEYRSSLLSDSLKETVEPNFISKSDVYLQSVVNRFADKQRIAGLAVVDNTGNLIAVSSSLPKAMSQPEQVAADVMDADKANGNFAVYNGKRMYVFATPLHDKKNVVGALVVVQNASYIDTQLLDLWTSSLLRLLIQIIIISLVVLIVLRWIFFDPVQRLALSLKDIRLSKSLKKAQNMPRHPLFGPLMQEVSNMQQSLVAARLTATQEARLRLEKLDSPWTDERLKTFTKDLLKERAIFMVSNREPYIHTKNGSKVQYYFPASGMATAIEPIMQACGGMWIAQGTGNADKQVVDSDDKIQVPPDDPKYTLKRIWLSEQEEKGYYYGFSNEGIWPLCHNAHTRPIFRQGDWEQYQKVNQKFADTVIAEIKDFQNPIIIVQDFHLALLPRLIKNVRPDATIGMFWHIPWPNAESFSICPWKKELLDGMLGSDLIGFHTQLHCNNFITTVGRELEALIDLEQFSITKNGHSTFIKPFPISIAFAGELSRKQKHEPLDREKLLEKYGISTKYLAIGVDRLDYTKGILERIKAVEIFLNKYPEYKEQFTFLQISAPSRGSIKEYQDFAVSVEKEVNRVNEAFRTDSWEPIVFVKRHHNHEELNQLYKAADVCLVTSLHDGMNLVAKEFIAARSDEKGVLVLSQFAGASRELRDAFIVNPYNGEQVAEAIYNGLTMKKAEQVRRMKRLRDTVVNYNVYRWSAELLKAMVSLG
jgi:trehalose 6-phosphate synthase